jgi:hypothetical protein
MVKDDGETISKNKIGFEDGDLSYNSRLKMRPENKSGRSTISF